MSKYPSSSPPGDGRRGGGLLYVTAAGAWLFLLYGFVPLQAAVPLALLGAGLAYGGLYLAVAGLPLVLESPWYAGAWVLGLLMLAGAAATLAPAAPGELLATNEVGWVLLDRRTRALEETMRAGDVELARKIASRGLGDPVPRDGFGIPLLHLAEGREMMAALLDGGLDPDARNAEGQTLLMRPADPEIARVLLAAAANPNARQRNGATVLMLRGNDPVETIELLLEAGADVHAVDDGGRTVADMVRGPGRALLERYAGGRPLEESGDTLVRGREEWLVAQSGAPPVGVPSSLSLDPATLLPGEVGLLTIDLANGSPADRVLDVRAVLNDAVLLVSASHDGAVESLGRVDSTSTVRWPPLALPAERRGRLELQVLARPDHTFPAVPPGDWSVDVRVLELPQRTEEVLQHYQERQAPSARTELVGPTSFLPVLLLFVPGLAAWLWWRRRGREGSDQARRFRMGREASAFAALVCAATAVGLTWSILEPAVRFEEANCRVLDHRVLSREVRDAGSRGSRSQRSVQIFPLAAVEVVTANERRITAGLSSGMASRTLRDLRSRPIGATGPCWLDPNNANRITLMREASLSGIAGVVLLLFLALIFGTAAARLGRGGVPREE